MPKSTAISHNRHHPRHSAKTFKSAIQHYGMYFAAFPWQVYLTGTYRSRKSQVEAEKTFYKFYWRLSSAMRAPISYIAVPERTTSGLGKPPGPWHWHALLCGPKHKCEVLLRLAHSIWADLNGDVKVSPYAGDRGAAWYLAKTAEQNNFEFHFDKLDRLSPVESVDLFEAQQTDQHIPDHVRHMISYSTLAVQRNDEETAPNHLDECEVDDGRNR